MWGDAWCTHKHRKVKRLMGVSESMSELLTMNMDESLAGNIGIILLIHSRVLSYELHVFAGLRDEQVAVHVQAGSGSSASIVCSIADAVVVQHRCRTAKARSLFVGVFCSGCCG